MPSSLKINPPVFFGSILIVVLFSSIGVLFPDRAGEIFGQIQSSILKSFGWLYLLAVGIFLAAAIIFSMGRFGRLKLGPDDSVPDFRFSSWVAMLFAAGMGIGIMFYAVSEPITHFMAPPTAEPRSVAAVREAMAVTFFHWGIHAWAIYAVVGLSLAYFGYRYNLPLTIRSGLYPLLKDRIHGPIGHAVDIFAVVSTIFGLATSMGLGVLQINAGLNYLLGVPATPLVQLALMAFVTFCATASALSGVEKGVRLLSETNMVVAIALMLFVIVVGPSSMIFRDFVQNIGLYLDTMVLRTFNIFAYGPPKPWIEDWTLFYWAWWIAWAPFVGMFIARISRGRTVQEFVVAVLFVPAGFTFFWMTVFGNTAIFIDTTVANGALSAAVAKDMSMGLYHFLEYLPFTPITCAVAIFLVAISFISSADSGALVVDAIASGGDTDTPALQRLFWCLLIAVVATVLLLAGGLDALQSATITSALPFTLVTLALVWALFVGMKADLAQREAQSAQPVVPPAQPASGLTWQRRLALILHAPSQKEVEAFILREVRPALEQVAGELTRRGRPAEVREENGAVALHAPAEGMRDFTYGVTLTAHRLPAFSAHEAAKPENRYEARTHFSNGARDYDVMAMTRDQIIADVLAQFECYLLLVQSPQTQLVAGAPEHVLAV
ncbi:transporter [Azorhizobium oxalatiphilum]|uniref:Transporter n=1 Tax=Azorhizobium oxalatiphilum TaxID=980631 RepID=A0A917FHN4_9HYPH|nr:BCCT family transporter [Azorhizobium oxalatiphilum]GGF83823.1 transporter [Azorhizobium oxalatiphilum]